MGAGVLTRIASLASVVFVAFVASPQTLVGETPESGVTTKMDHPRLRAKSAIHSEPAGPAAPAQVRLANISTRLAVGSGGSVLIAGFIITGSEPKRILLRALGPLLPVKENLADPTLELHNSSGLVAANDNWRDTQEDELQATTIPPGSDYESAIVKVLNPGAYTAVLSGKGQTTGVGLVEVYDLDLLLDSRLANISTRGFVDQGDNVLIAGTIVFGGTPANVLFRALGPSLPGVPNALQDTTLELFDGQGSAVASNDNWRDSQAAEIKATTIPPSDPREAAILRQLTPGAYTAIVRGKNNSTGVALVEAYHFN